jgi:hypothetical protein
MPVRAYFAVMAAAYALAAALGLGLTWDGAYYLFQALNTGQAFMPRDRLLNLPLQQPVITARGITDNPAFLAAIFGASYLLVPLACLAAPWLIVRDRQPRLFIWSVLGIGLLSLPGQAAVQSEPIMAFELTWPILLAVLTGEVSEHWALILAFSIALVLAHPLAIPLLAGVTGAAALVYVVRREGERPELWWVVVFAVLAGLAWLRTSTAEAWAR